LVWGLALHHWALKSPAFVLLKLHLAQSFCLTGKDAEEIESHLYRLFKLHDVDNSGYLDPKEFVACIQSLDLGLTIST
jgi:Ca2+-binding EF-hand superfamily protein